MNDNELLINRLTYIDKIKPFMDIKIVKILAGVRRSGKSTILKMIANELRMRGVDNSHIIIKKYSNVEFADNYNALRMYNDLKAEIVDNQKYYFLLDELQEVDGWEKVVNTLMEEFNTDIYITGSNSKLMSGEIATYLSGRYVKIDVYTLSFKEYLDFKNNSNKSVKEHLFDYIRFGGFPLVTLSNLDEKSSYTIVEDIYNSVVMNDVIKRHNVLNIDLFNKVVKFIIDNVGKTFSANSIVKFLKSENRTISVEAIYNYLEWLEKAFVVYRCKRFDLQGKNILKTQEKFFIADQSIKFALLGYNPTAIASMLENIVFFELKRRGYDVYIGKNASKEIDFVAVKRNERLYIQVCRDLPQNSDREVVNLMEIKDNYPKIIVTLNDFAFGNFNGIMIMHLADFLLSSEF